MTEHKATKNYSGIYAEQISKIAPFENEHEARKKLLEAIDDWRRNYLGDIRACFEAFEATGDRRQVIMATDLCRKWLRLHDGVEVVLRSGEGFDHYIPVCRSRDGIRIEGESLQYWHENMKDSHEWAKEPQTKESETIISDKLS